MRARKRRHRISRRAVEQRRDRVRELRLAGLSPANIAEELRKEELFKHTTEDMVWNDIKALEKRAELEEIAPESIVKEIVQKCRDSYNVISKAAHQRFKEINDRIAGVQELIAEVDELLQDPQQSVNSRGQLITQYDRLISLASKLRKEARAETRIILSINKTMIDLPRKLGLLSERKEVGEYDDMAETIIKAAQDEPDRERRKKIIEAVELLAGII